MIFGSQTDVDVATIFKTIDSAHRAKELRFLEVGVFGGDTARGVKEWCDEREIRLEYWGIDNAAQGANIPPFPEAHYVLGDSAEVFHLIPDGFDAVLIDGCHCVNHVILDTIHYGRRVRPGGYLLFHDTSPEIQQTMKDPHGPKIPEFHNSVLLAHRLMYWPHLGWREVFNDYKRGAPWGGITVYQDAIKIPQSILDHG